MNKKLSVFIVVLIITLVISVTGCTQSSSKKKTSSEKESGTQEKSESTKTEEIKPRGFKSSETANSTMKAQIKNFAFMPSEIKIKKGDTVIWTNEDPEDHNVISVPGSVSGNELNSGTLSQNQTYSHTFNNTGTFEYYCSIHPSSMTKAKVIVE